MYTISVVINECEANIALYGEDRKPTAQKNGVCKERLANACLDIMAEHGVKAENVKLVGIAASAPVSARNELAKNLEKELNIKAVAEDITNARALGEAYISGVPSLAIVKVDDKVESGVVIDKKVYSGIDGNGGKVAHMVINYGGFECTCGRKGCFEAYASNSGLKCIASEAGIKDIDNLTVPALFAMTDDSAKKAKHTYTEYLGSALTDVINLFQPDELVLDGPFTKAGSELFEPLTEMILKEQYSRNLDKKCKIRFANDETATALLGAALLG